MSNKKNPFIFTQELFFLPFVNFKIYERQRYSVAYSKGHTVPMFYYLFIFSEALLIEVVVVKSSEAHLVENRKF